MYATLIWYIVSSSSDRWVLTPRLRVIQIGEGTLNWLRLDHVRILAGGPAVPPKPAKKQLQEGGTRMRGETTKGLLTRCPRHQSRAGAPIAA